MHVNPRMLRRDAGKAKDKALETKREEVAVAVESDEFAARGSDSRIGRGVPFDYSKYMTGAWS